MYLHCVLNFYVTGACDSPDVSNSNWAPELDRGHTRYGESIVVECDEGFTSGEGSVQNETLYCSEGLWDGTVICYGKTLW